MGLLPGRVVGAALVLDAAGDDAVEAVAWRLVLRLFTLGAGGVDLGDQRLGLLSLSGPPGLSVGVPMGAEGAQAVSEGESVADDVGAAAFGLDREHRSSPAPDPRGAGGAGLSVTL